MMMSVSASTVVLTVRVNNPNSPSFDGSLEILPVMVDRAE